MLQQISQCVHVFVRFENPKAKLYFKGSNNGVRQFTQMQAPLWLWFPQVPKNLKTTLTSYSTLLLNFQ